MILTSLTITRLILSSPSSAGVVMKEYPNIRKFLYDMIEANAQSKEIVTQILHCLCQIDQKGEAVCDATFSRFCKSLFSVN